MRGVGAVIVACLLALPAAAAPPDPALQKQLLGIFDDYNAAIARGDVDKALPLRSKEAQNNLTDAMKAPQDKAEFLEMSKFMVPDSLEVVHGSLSKDGGKVTLRTVASKKVPPGMKGEGLPPAGTVVRSELTLDFVKESGTWKYDNQIFGMDPDKIKACTDDKFEPIAAYDESSSLSMGGPITRVAFNAEYTLVVVRVVDEETCTFLPDKATLAKAGFDPGHLVPYAIVSIEGFKHKTSPQKVWVDSIDVQDED